jgi:hypothetical protein
MGELNFKSKQKIWKKQKNNVENYNNLEFKEIKKI